MAHASRDDSAISATDFSPGPRQNDGKAAECLGLSASAQ